MTSRRKSRISFRATRRLKRRGDECAERGILSPENINFSAEMLQFGALF